MYSFSGTVEAVFKTQAFGSKGFTKRFFWVKQAGDSKYPNIVQFTLKKEKCELADGLKRGDEVTVKFVVEGRVWDKGDGSAARCFCDNVCLSLDKEGGASVPAPAEPPADVQQDDALGDDMPF